MLWLQEIILKTINPVVSDSQNMFNENIKKRIKIWIIDGDFDQGKWKCIEQEEF